MSTPKQPREDHALCGFVGQILLENNTITKGQLEEAIAIQHQTGELIGQILVERGALSQDDLIETLGDQLHTQLEEAGIHHRQLGEILLSLHAISRWQLSRALELQQEKTENNIPPKIGQLLVELGYTSRGTVEQALSNQSMGEGEAVCCEHRRTLGQLLLQSNKVTPLQLKEALAVQKNSHKYLGEILVEQGVLDEEELEDILAAQMIISHQHAQHHAAQQAELKPVKKRLGEILVDTHQLTPHQLHNAMEEQKESKRKLGDILVEKGLVPLKELMRALRLQKRLATLAMVTLTGFTLLSACGAPKVPAQYSLQTYTNMQLQGVGPSTARKGPFKVLQVENDRQLQVFQNGSRVIDNVPFIRQGKDNTCGQAVITAMLNYWGMDVEYQQVVNEANPGNLPTTDQALAGFLRKKGMNAQAFRGGKLDNLIAEINKGRPTPVLLDFGGISQEHYVIVVGYNLEKKTMIVHDSLEGPYIEMPMTSFTKMWENQSLRILHVFGGESYRRLMFQISPKS